MPRKPSHTREDLIEDAMHHFWRYGYAGSSMDDLVQSTGVARHGIYKDVGSKRDLYLEGFETYQNTIVTPCFGPVEAPEAELKQIEAYFHAQISLAEAIGLPGPGCHMANAMTETAPHDPAVEAQVEAHNARLQAGFENAVRNSASFLSSGEVTAIAQFLVITTQGLWSLSRIVHTTEPMYGHVATLMDLLRARLRR